MIVIFWQEIFEQVAKAYEFLCSKEAKKKAMGPDPKNIVLVLQAQSILFKRYKDGMFFESVLLFVYIHLIFFKSKYWMMLSLGRIYPPIYWSRLIHNVMHLFVKKL